MCYFSAITYSYSHQNVDDASACTCTVNSVPWYLTLTNISFLLSYFQFTYNYNVAFVSPTQLLFKQHVHVCVYVLIIKLIIMGESAIL